MMDADKHLILMVKGLRYRISHIIYCVGLLPIPNNDINNAGTSRPRLVVGVLHPGNI